MNNYKGSDWKLRIDVRDFVHNNYTPYDGDESFLAESTERTKKMWGRISDLIKEEVKRGILDLDTDTPSTITSHKPGYIDKESELIVGLQTDAPMKRAIKPYGGVNFVKKAAEGYGYEISKEVEEFFNTHRKTHNQGVFDVYDPEIRKLRSTHIITGLPDNYGRGRIIGDYRRLALYGADKLIEEKRKFLAKSPDTVTENLIRLREEISDQIKALEQIKIMANSYGYDVSRPAEDTREAVQWIYFAFLAAVKEQDGAAMSMGRIDTFIDIYAEEDLRSGKYTEEEIQEIIDDFVMKLRIVRHLRHELYNALFAGDPTWITIVLGGATLNGDSLVTKTSFRFLNTLSTLGPAPEPNLTVLWSSKISKAWKDYCSKQSIISSSIQYENDDLMKEYYGDDYGIACCVSGMAIGKEMQFFGARANLVKALLLAINGGKEERVELDGKVVTEGGEVIIPGLKPLNESDYLNYEEVWDRYKEVIRWLAQRYVRAMNEIHYMHDKYNYEAAQMAFHDDEIKRNMAFGAAGLSIVADSLSAIKYAKVKPVWNEDNIAVDYLIEGDYPKFGNDDDRVDQIAIEVVRNFIESLKEYETYRDSRHTLSILTITSNVVYGNSTGATPDGRDSGVPFAPGANPMHGRDSNGAVASLNSVAKIPYHYCLDGISNTFSIVPTALGKDQESQISNLTQMMDGYFLRKNAHHLNVNVFDKETLLDAQKNPEKYPQLTIRVSGYAVLFNKLSKAQQDEVIARTFHSQR
ncbi:MAG TPA: formate C-acetyltransferase [bacterium]|nr:formate C-acetyltransferase [bacterium]